MFKKIKNFFKCFLPLPARSANKHHRELSNKINALERTFSESLDGIEQQVDQLGEGLKSVEANAEKRTGELATRFQDVKEQVSKLAAKDINKSTESVILKADSHDITIDDNGEYENENVKIVLKEPALLSNFKQTTEWRMISNPDENGTVYPNGKFGAKPVMTLLGDVLSIEVPIDADTDKLENCFYLYRYTEEIEKIRYNNIYYKRYEWRLESEGEYSVHVYIKKRGAHYRTCDCFKPLTNIVYRKISLSDLFLSETEKQIHKSRDLYLAHLYELIFSAVSAGVDVFAHLREQGFKRIAVYSESGLGVQVFRMAYYKECFIDVFSDIKSQTEWWAQKVYFFAVTQNYYKDLLDTDENTALIMLDANNTEAVDEIGRNTKIKIFDGMHLFSELLFEKTIINPVIEFSYGHPSIKILILSSFGLEGLGNNEELSEHEKRLIKDSSKHIFIDYVKEHCSDENFVDPVYTAYGKNSDYILGVQSSPKIIYTDNGIIRLGDKESKYINVLNNYRVTTAVPETYKNTIWVFGASPIMGMLNADWETIPSQLQYIVNDRELPFAVVNCSNYYSDSTEQQWRFLETLPISDGDMVVSMVQNEAFDILKDYFYTCDLRTVFKRPHEYGEVFFDNRHVNSIGNEILAKAIFDRMNELNMFEDEKYEQKQVTLQNTFAHGGIASSNPPDDLPLTSEETGELQSFITSLLPLRVEIGAIVMNCNPFTLGHRYLIEYAASKVTRLYIFVVEEDKSVFAFADRIQLVKQGTEDLANVTVLPSGKFIISQRTFAAYSSKEELQDTIIDPSMDVELFATKIAPTLNITVRFAGEEPLDNITRQYNDTMSRLLPRYGIRFDLIPRKEVNGEVISASRVRKLLEDQNFDEIAKIVPETTLLYLKKNYKTEV